MFDYSPQIQTFQNTRVRLPTTLLDKLRAHRKANRDRIISRLPERIKGITVGDDHFKPQGSVAMETIIQTKFADEEYDIDDGLVLPRSKLVDQNGTELDAGTVREHLRLTLEDGRFKRQPKLMTNCVRVFYAAEDAEKHHVDFPVYRRSGEGNESIRELAGSEGWFESDPTQVNDWFRKQVEQRNAEGAEGDQRGTQLRRLVRLLKRFCRSREDWLELLPNGMKLTMLVVECQPAYDERIDRAFRDLLENIASRLRASKIIRNLAHPEQPAITRGDSDPNVEALQDKVEEVLAKLANLVDLESARDAWEWVFQSDGYFEKHDAAIADSSVQKALARRDSAVQLGVPWVEPLPWPEIGRVAVYVDGHYKLEGVGGWRRFESGASLSKGLRLKFVARFRVSGRYDVYWQVVNTGVEAHRARCLRGELLESEVLQSNAAPGVRLESTAYTGRHWVEAFVVQGGRCLGRSGPFVVAIE